MVALTSVVNRNRWLGWIRHIVRDQVAVWMVASFLGMALPCMMSVEFIRNQYGRREPRCRYGGQRHGGTLHRIWPPSLDSNAVVRLPCAGSGPGETSTTRSQGVGRTLFGPPAKRAKQLKGNQVKYIYYGIMSVYLVWGLVMLTLFDPLDLAKFGAVIGTVALGSSSLLALYANRTLLPKGSAAQLVPAAWRRLLRDLLFEFERCGFSDLSRVRREFTGLGAGGLSVKRPLSRE